MNKLIKFCKKPLAIISGTVFVLFLVMLIVLFCIPKVKNYEYHYETFGMEMDYSITFKDDENLEMKITMTYLGEILEDQTIPSRYEIKKGKLYTYDEDVKEEVGKINAFRIKFNFPGEYKNLLDDMQLKCKWMISLRSLAISMMSISFAFGMVSVLIFVLDKKGILAKKQNDNVEDSQENKETLNQENK